MAAFKMKGGGAVAPKLGRSMAPVPKVGKPVIGKSNLAGGQFGVARVKATVRGGAKGLINR